MQPSLTIARNESARLSKRVARLRCSFSHPTRRSTAFRRAYCARSSTGGRPRRRRALPAGSFRSGITARIRRSRSHARIRLAS